MNYLKPILPLVAVLAVFGWSHIATQPTAFGNESAEDLRSQLTRPASVITASKTEVRKLRSVLVSRETVALAPATRLISIESTNGDAKTTATPNANRRRYAKPKLDLNPAFSRPDFGTSDHLRFKDLRQIELRLPPSNRSPSRPAADLFLDQATRYPRLKSQPIRDTGTSSVAFHRTPAPQAALTFVRVEPIVPSTSGLAQSIPESSDSDLKTDAPSVAANPVANAPKIHRTESKPAALTKPEKQPARLNIRALSERVEAHNYSVTTLEQRLEEQDSWSPFSLRLVLEEVQEIRKQQSLWSLYWDILESAKKDRIGDVLSLDGVYDKLQQRIFESRIEVDLEPEVDAETRRTKSTLEEMNRIIEQWRES